MLKNSFVYLALLGFAFFSIGCSSIKKRALNLYLGGFQDKKAERMHYLPPLPPYQEQNHPVLDALWWNPQSKSSISYFSSCSKVQQTLKEFQTDSFPQNSQYKILKSFESKESLYSILEIFNSSQHTYSGIYTLKARGCYFNINLVASSYSSFEKEEPVFQTFIKGFKVK